MSTCLHEKGEEIYTLEKTEDRVLRFQGKKVIHRQTYKTNVKHRQILTIDK